MEFLLLRQPRPWPMKILAPNLVRVKSVEFVALKKALDFSILGKF